MHYYPKKNSFEIPDCSHDTKKFRYFAYLLLTFHSVFLDVHVFQIKVKIFAIKILKTLHFKIEIVAVFIWTCK